MTVKRIQCVLYTSNIYMLEEDTSDSVWLVDCGDGELVVPEGKTIEGVFITHPHIDHIIGLNALLDRYPSLVVYASKSTKEDLYNSKMNLSFYHQLPFEYKGRNVQVLAEGDELELFPDSTLQVLETPGHNPGCLSFIVNKYLFTGDSLVPGFPVVTKLKGGDKIKASESLLRLNILVQGGYVICPGHGDVVANI